MPNTCPHCQTHPTATGQSWIARYTVAIILSCDCGKTWDIQWIPIARFFDGNELLAGLLEMGYGVLGDSGNEN